LKAKHTNKLFFSKYAYRFVIKSPHISCIRYPEQKQITALFNSETYEEYLANAQYRKKMWRTWQDTDVITKGLWKSRFVINKVFEFKEKYQNKHNDFTIRLESNTCGVYSNDKEMFENGCAIFKNEICELTWPKNERHLKFLLDNPTNEIVEAYPYNKYRYRVNLRDKRLTTDQKENFKDWIKTYSNLKISDETLRRIKLGGYNLNGKFLYSTNKEMMLLLQLYLGDAIKSITEFKLEKDI
jgi:hypothetical protein